VARQHCAQPGRIAGRATAGAAVTGGERRALNDRAYCQSRPRAKPVGTTSLLGITRPGRPRFVQPPAPTAGSASSWLAASPQLCWIAWATI
jgi:hypothetical protein